MAWNLTASHCSGALPPSPFIAQPRRSHRNRPGDLKKLLFCGDAECGLAGDRRRPGQCDCSIAGWNLRRDAHKGRRLRSVEPIAQLDAGQGKYLPVAIDVSNPAEHVYLTIYGTCFRNLASLNDMTVNVSSATTPPVYAGPAGQYPGRDQMNLLLPASLAGKGQVYVVIAIGDLDNEANLVWLQIK